MAYATCGVVGAGLIAVIDHAVDYCVIGGDSSGDLRCIADEPKKGYSYRYRRSGKNISGGISQYLQVFNRKGQLLENIYMGKIPYTRIIKRF